MTWKVNTTPTFDRWFLDLSDECQADVAAKVRLLEEHGPHLGRPNADTLDTERDAASRHTHMKELRVQHQGDPYRVLFAFDTAREAKLLVGGCKTGNDRWYHQNIPIADDLLDAHELVLAANRRIREQRARTQRKRTTKDKRTERKRR